MNKVQAKEKQMDKEVKQFKEIQKNLFEKGIPSFWDNNGKLISKDNYDTLLTQVRLDHSKFENLEKGLKGEDIANKLSNDFDVLGQFQVIKSNLSPICFTSCIELQVSLREMVGYEIPSQNYWNQVEKYGRMKCTTQ